jgi:hypothetical protein
MEIKIIETNTECCCNCKGHGKDCEKGAWIYCDLRHENEELFNGDCGETLGCDHFSVKQEDNSKEGKQKEITKYIALIMMELLSNDTDVNLVMQTVLHIQTLKAQPLADFDDGGISSKRVANLASVEDGGNKRECVFSDKNYSFDELRERIRDNITKQERFRKLWDDELKKEGGE